MPKTQIFSSMSHLKITGSIISMKFIFFLVSFLSVCVAYRAKSQGNLLLNGGFEAHGEQKCLACNTLYGQYPALVYNWDNGGWACILCDKDYKRTSDDNKMGNPFDKLSPKDGKAMIEMSYAPGCYALECATYLSSRTIKPMRVGQLYETSFWLYIESTRREDPDWANHIGIALLPQNLKVHGLSGKKLILPPLSIDTIIYDKWYQVKWRVRPLCTSNYLMIGIFGDDHWPASKSYANVRYYIDNVKVLEILEQSAVGDSSIYYCSRYDPKTLGIPPQMDNQILLFKNKAFDLTAEHKEVLDSFALFAKEYTELVFELSGHTDSIGTDNLALSHNRVQSVYNYLTDVQNLPPFRLIALSKGGNNPFRPNSTEEGRKMNRRVEIRQSNLNLPMMFYRNALKSVAVQNYAEAFKWLNKWLINPNRGGSGGRIILLFDPRLEILRKDIIWSSVEKKIRDEYRSFKYPGYAFLLDSLRLDEFRASGVLTMSVQRGLNSLPGYIPDWDSVLYELPVMPEEILQKKYKAHFSILRTILGKVGWPKKSEFGESACDVAFNMLLNSNELLEWLEWLPVIQKTCEEGEAPWIYYAMLYDQCNLALGKPQRYVTDVGYLENGDLMIKHWEGDENSVNDYRAKIGLPLLSAAVAEVMKRN